MAKLSANGVEVARMVSQWSEPDKHGTATRTTLSLRSTGAVLRKVDLRGGIFGERPHAGGWSHYRKLKADGDPRPWLAALAAKGYEVKANDADLDRLAAGERSKRYRMETRGFGSRTYTAARPLSRWR